MIYTIIKKFIFIKALDKGKLDFQLQKCVEFILVKPAFKAVPPLINVNQYKNFPMMFFISFTENC